MNLIVTILEQGLIYGILSLGLYITYKILDFPDLTVDGSFPLGAAVTAALITRGVNPYLTLLVAFAAGVLAGYYDDSPVDHESVYCRNGKCTVVFTAEYF